MAVNWGIAKKENVILEDGADTTNSRYAAIAATVFRKFATRSLARAYKRQLKTPQAYAIIQMDSGTVVR